MGKYIKRPIMVEAEQFYSQAAPLPFRDQGACMFDGERWYVVTAHGQKTEIIDGDWIIKEPDGRGFYPCKPDIFEGIYMKVDEQELEVDSSTPLTIKFWRDILHKRESMLK